MTTSREQDEFFTAKRFALFLAVVLGVMFFRVLLAGETFYYRDFGVLAIPTATFHKTSVLAGEIPFWNPYSNCGTPFLAQWGTMVLYPLSLIYVLLPMPWSLNFFCIVHLWLGGMGMYFLAKRWCGGAWPAALAGFAFTFNGITLAALAWPNYIAAISLTPWVLLLTERVWTPHAETNSLRRTTISGEVIAAALASALQLLAGVPELSVFTWLLVTAFWAARVVRTPAVFKPLLLLYVAVVLATAGLASIQLLPFYELLTNSHRSPGFAAEKWALPIWGWANLILPRFRTFVTPQGTAFQYTQEFLTSVYIGIPLLVLAWCSFLRRTPRFWILAIASALGAVLALGSAGILYPILTKLFPPLGIARYPVKFLFLLAFTIPLLAAFGANALFEMPDRRRRTILVFSTAAVAVLLGALIAIDHATALPFERLAEFRQNSLIRICFAFSMLVVFYFATTQTPKRATAQFVFLILLVLDARTHLQKLNPSIAASIFKGELWPGAHPFPKPVHGQARAFISREAEEKLLYSPVADDEKELIGKRLAEWSHLNLLDRVPKVNGSSTLQVREQARVQSSLYSGTNQHLEAWLDFLNVRYKSASNSVVEWEQRNSASPFVTAGQAPLLNIVDPLDQALSFTEQVILHSPPPDIQGLGKSTVTISNLTISTHEVRFDANTPSASVAVISQTWFPGWKGTIQRQGAGPVREDVLRANLAFQAVVIPAGQSSVRIYYDDRNFKLGIAVLGATLLISGLSWVREKKNTLPKNEKSAR